MRGSTAATKMRTYQAIYLLNLSFANIVRHCGILGESGILSRKYARLYQSFAQELQAQINEELLEILHQAELDDWSRFGKVREAWEKSIRDPDDVFIHAEERRKELAKQKGARRTSICKQAGAAQRSNKGRQK